MYTEMYNSITVSDRVKPILDLINKGKTTYQAIANKAKVPWYIIGIVHYKEASCRFDRHLHNGDPLSAKTVHVPANRPRQGVPPYTFEQSALDALSDRPNSDWSIEGALYWLEAYNGFGYKYKGINSPYLWAGTKYYTKGLYVSDGVFDPNAVFSGVGVAMIMKGLLADEPTVVNKSKWQLLADRIRAALRIIKK